MLYVVRRTFSPQTMDHVQPVNLSTFTLILDQVGSVTRTVPGPSFHK